MEDKTIKETWSNIEKKNNWKDFILPQRSEKVFWNEGKAQANQIKKHYDNSDGIILDFGCGIGRILEHLKAKEKHGADASAKFLRAIDNSNSDIVTHYSDGLNIIQDYDYFDFIFSIMVFQHNEKKHHTDILKNLYKCLKTGGKILIQFPQKPNEYYKETTFVNLYTKDELKSMFNATGYVDIQIKEGNLVGYGKNGEYKPKGNLEYFVSAYKPK